MRRDFFVFVSMQLPEYYAYKGGCSGRNELGTSDATLLNCLALCDEDDTCTSFEYDEASTSCHRSTSCTYEFFDENVDTLWALYVKKLPGQIPPLI